MKKSRPDFSRRQFLGTTMAGSLLLPGLAMPAPRAEKSLRPFERLITRVG